VEAQRREPWDRRGATRGECGGVGSACEQSRGKPNGVSRGTGVVKRVESLAKLGGVPLADGGG